MVVQKLRSAKRLRNCPEAGCEFKYVNILGLTGEHGEINCVQTPNGLHIHIIIIDTLRCNLDSPKLFLLNQKRERESLGCRNLYEWRLEFIN